MKVLLANPMDDSHLMEIHYTIDFGFLDDPQEYHQFAHLMEHLNASSSKNFSRKYVTDMHKKYHAISNASTNFY